nr:hypothetical protein Iba_chr02dCG3270 [Ipomoea batatas]
MRSCKFPFIIMVSKLWCHGARAIFYDNVAVEDRSWKLRCWPWTRNGAPCSKCFPSKNPTSRVEKTEEGLGSEEAMQSTSTCSPFIYCLQYSRLKRKKQNRILEIKWNTTRGAYLAWNLGSWISG